MLAVVSMTGLSYAQQSGTMSLGKMSMEEFKQKNAQGAAAVSAITPTDVALSVTDKQLMLDVALGGMMQLEVSKIAVQKATNEAVRTLAQGEVDEQTGLSAKLKAIAAVKRVALPAMPRPRP